MESVAELINHIIRSPIFWMVAPNVAFLLLIFIVSLWERQWTQPFAPVRSADARALPEYVKVISDAAMAAGFEFDRLIVNARRRGCREMATVWMSGDRRILAFSRAGTVFGTGTFQTLLFSRSPEGRLLVTTDNEDGGDRSGLYRIKRAIRRPFGVLLARHEERLRRYGKWVEPFGEETAMESYFAIMERRVDLMVRSGVARYIESDRTRWRYTGWGALRNCGAGLVQMAMGLPQFFRRFMRPVGSHKLVELGETVWERYGKAGISGK
jgi:hypothetical protein